MRFVSGEGLVLDEVYITAISTRVWSPDSNPSILRISWAATIKPLAVDEILWAGFLPDAVMGPQVKINRRINGAYQIQPLRFHEVSRDVPADATQDWGAVLDDFERARAEFITTHPTAATFAGALQHNPDRIAPNRAVTRLVTALIADETIAHGESGSMRSTVDVLKYLSAYAKGPIAWDEFTASLRRATSRSHCPTAPRSSVVTKFSPLPKPPSCSRRYTAPTLFPTATCCARSSATPAPARSGRGRGTPRPRPDRRLSLPVSEPAEWPCRTST